MNGYVARFMQENGEYRYLTHTRNARSNQTVQLFATVTDAKRSIAGQGFGRPNGFYTHVNGKYEWTHLPSVPTEIVAVTVTFGDVITV